MKPPNSSSGVDSLADNTQEASTWHDAPLVIVEGFLCATSDIVWGDFAKHIEIGSQQQRRQDYMYEQANCDNDVPGKPYADRQVVFAPVGPVSSIHDRACELFYALRGGTVDYGARHAAAHGHRRFGRHYARGLLPEWGHWTENGQPKLRAHFIGHSLGGLTIVKLYDLLSQGFFDESLARSTRDGRGRATSAMLSIMTISSPLRGTPLVYTLGLEPNEPLPRLRFLSVGDCLAKFVHLATWARRLPLSNFSFSQWLPDFHAEAWDFAGHSTNTEKEGVDKVATSERPSAASISELFGIKSLISQLRRSIWAEGTDCAPWDCTFAQRTLMEGSGGIWSGNDCASDDAIDQVSMHATGNCIWLRSVAATISDPCNDQSPMVLPSPAKLLQSGPLGILSHFLTHFDYGKHPHPTDGFWHPLSPEFDMETDSGYASDADSRNTEYVERKRSACDYSERDPNLLDRDSIEDRSMREWRANDGVVPLASQYHPGPCRPGHCHHTDDEREYTQTALRTWASQIRRVLWSSLFGTGKELSADTPYNVKYESFTGTNANLNGNDRLPAPNVWHVFRSANTSHATLAPLWIGSAQQIDFWQDVGRWLARVEMATTVIDS